MQKNIRQSDTGAWIVECREEGDRRWTTVYHGGSETDARAAFRKL